jgi:hypothetical protein
MSFNLRKARTVATVIMSLAAAFLSFRTQAVADVEYSKVGWWQVSYKEVDELTGCDARAEFQDQTKIAIAFIRGDNNEGWSVFISNPRWGSWVSRKREHVLWLVTINPNKLWHGTWSASDVSGQLYLSARPEFINSLANAKAIGIFDDSKRSLTSAPVSMKDSEDALKAREYRPREPISISCSDRVCTVNGIVDFRAIDPIGKVLSEGVATFEYRLVVTGTALKISLENGSVLSRNRTTLSSVSSYERDGAPVSPVSERHGNRRATWQTAR